MTLSRYWALTLAQWGILLVSIIAFLFFDIQFETDPLVFGITVLGLMAASALLVKVLIQGDANRIRALQCALNNLKDNDFSHNLSTAHRDEIDDLIVSYNQLTEKFRHERQWLYQRELMLDTIMENVDLALYLVDQNDTIIFANHQASQLLNKGESIVGSKAKSLSNVLLPHINQLMKSKQHGIIELEAHHGVEKYLVSSGQLSFHANQHQLILIKPLTRELYRQESLAWKKVLRVVSHEINNSLAPISSMAHSAQLALDKNLPEHTANALSAITQNTTHLSHFLELYTQLAKISTPKKEKVHWSEFIKTLQQMIDFIWIEPNPSLIGYFDPAQLQQVLMNIIKNAHESGSDPAEIKLCLKREKHLDIIDVIDRGAGMSKSVMEQATLPFYTTKTSGNGIGLNLCREIIEQHEGVINFENRKQGGLKVTICLSAES